MENNTNIIQWAEESLLLHGVIIKKPPEQIQKTPYSSVIRFSTTEGYIYLKQMPALLSFEPKMMRFLHDKFHANVPIVIDSSKIFNCFLMKDAGRPLREILKDNFQKDLLVLGLEKYTEIQSVAASHINTFLELGVNDWRLDKLPKLYTQLIDEEILLQQEGLRSDELKLLYELSPTFSAVCELLSNYKINQTIDHCDFHDNNILIENNTHNLTIIDWAEVVITHPFFSLNSYLSYSAYRYALKETDETFIELEDACFKNWLGIETRNNLLNALRLAKKLWPIYSALGYYRLILSSTQKGDAESIQSWFNSGRNKGRLSGYLRAFINTTEGLVPSDTSRVNLTDPYRPILG